MALHVQAAFEVKHHAAQHHQVLVVANTHTISGSMTTDLEKHTVPGSTRENKEKFKASCLTAGLELASDAVKRANLSCLARRGTLVCCGDFNLDKARVCAAVENVDAHFDHLAVLCLPQDALLPGMLGKEHDFIVTNVLDGELFYTGLPMASDGKHRALAVALPWQSLASDPVPATTRSASKAGSESMSVDDLLVLGVPAPPAEDSDTQRAVAQAREKAKRAAKDEAAWFGLLLVVSMSCFVFQVVLVCPNVCGRIICFHVVSMLSLFSLVFLPPRSSRILERQTT